MPPAGSCRICNHPRVSEIDGQLLAPGMNRRSLRGVAGLFGISHETLRRHYHACLGQVIAQDAAEDQQQTESIDEMGIRLTHENVAKLLVLDERAQRCGNPAHMMLIIRDLLKLLASMVKGI